MSGTKVDGWSNWETKAAFDWIANNPAESPYWAGMEAAKEGERAFREWAVRYLTALAEWDDADTPDVNFAEVLEALTDE